VRATAREPLLVLAVLAGAWLRLHQLGEQIVADDEWHALDAARNLRWGELFTHFGAADYCIPLALLDRLLMETVGLSETGMRAPVLAAGLAGLVLLPLLLRPLLGRATSTAFAWLLAVSPLHVYYSRFARPYDITLLLSFGGAIAAWRWWTGGSRRWAAASVACAVLAPWFNLVALPLSGAPLAALAADGLLRGTLDGRAARRLLATAGAIAAGLLLLLGPPLLVDGGTLLAKTGQPDVPGAAGWLSAARQWAGTSEDGVVAAVGAAALAGALVLARRQPRCVGYLLVLWGVQAGAVHLARPAFLEYVLARYVLVSVPVVLVLVATALAALEERLRRRLRVLPAGALAPLAAAALFWAGPLRFVYDGPNNWTNHAVHQYWYRSAGPWSFQKAAREADPAGFYARLGLFAPPGSLRLVEAPWSMASTENMALPLTQVLHRQWVCIGFVGDGSRAGELPAGDPRFRFRNFVHVGDEEGLQQRRVRLVVFHRDRLLPPDPPGEPLPDVEGWIERYRARWGRPLHEDEHMVVFDLGQPRDAASSSDAAR